VVGYFIMLSGKFVVKLVICSPDMTGSTLFNTPRHIMRYFQLFTMIRNACKCSNIIFYVGICYFIRYRIDMETALNKLVPRVIDYLLE